MYQQKVKDSSTNDVTTLVWRESIILWRKCISVKPKKRNYWGGRSKIIKNCLTPFMDDPSLVFWYTRLKLLFVKLDHFVCSSVSFLSNFFLFFAFSLFYNFHLFSSATSSAAAASAISDESKKGRNQNFEWRVSVKIDIFCISDKWSF